MRLDGDDALSECAQYIDKLGCTDEQIGSVSGSWLDKW